MLTQQRNIHNRDVKKRWVSPLHPMKSDNAFPRPTCWYAMVFSHVAEQINHLAPQVMRSAS
jgi:hypothetical protein